MKRERFDCSILFKLTVGMRDRLEADAATKGRSLSGHVREIILAYLNQEGLTTPAMAPDRAAVGPTTDQDSEPEESPLTPEQLAEMMGPTYTQEELLAIAAANGRVLR